MPIHSKFADYFYNVQNLSQKKTFPLTEIGPILRAGELKFWLPASFGPI
jgi:hypothetical protein